MTGRALRRLPRHDRPHKLDIPGVALMVAAAVALLLALDWGGTHYRWMSWQIWALIGGSAVLWVLFAVRLLTAREPFIPLAILRGRVTSAITCAAFFAIGTIDRRDHLRSALLPDGARRFCQPVRPFADCVHGRHHGRRA